MIWGASRKRPLMSDCQDRPPKRLHHNSEPSTATPSTSSLLNLEKLLSHHSSPVREHARNATMTTKKVEANMTELMHKHFAVVPPKKAGKKDDLSSRPLFTFQQVSLLCTKMLKEQQEKMQAEYDKILKEKLNEQYDTFIKFTYDQIQRDMRTDDNPSYMS